MKIIIVGAGIGGLTAAIGLRQDNHDVVVLDQASEFGEVYISPIDLCFVQSGKLALVLMPCKGRRWDENTSKLLQNLAQMGCRFHVHEKNTLKRQQVPQI